MDEAAQTLVKLPLHLGMSGLKVISFRLPIWKRLTIQGCLTDLTHHDPVLYQYLIFLVGFFNGAMRNLVCECPSRYHVARPGDPVLAKTIK